MPSARLLELQHQFNHKQDELVRLVSERQEDGISLQVIGGDGAADEMERCEGFEVKPVLKGLL